MGTFLGVAGLYVTLGADFLGAIQVLVYVGGILVLAAEVAATEALHQ